MLTLQARKTRTRGSIHYYAYEVTVGTAIVGAGEVLHLTHDSWARLLARIAERQGGGDDVLTLATICDMVLGEDAEDRSNAALVQAVGRLVRGE